jgi:hypothetical protein
MSSLGSDSGKTLKRSNKEFRANMTAFRMLMTAFVDSLASIEVVFQDSRGDLNVAEVFHHRMLSTLQVMQQERECVCVRACVLGVCCVCAVEEKDCFWFGVDL